MQATDAMKEVPDSAPEAQKPVACGSLPQAWQRFVRRRQRGHVGLMRGLTAPRQRR